MSDSEAPKKGFGYYFKKLFLHAGDVAGYDAGADSGFVDNIAQKPEGFMKTPEPTSGGVDKNGGPAQISPDVKKPKGFSAFR